VTQHYSRQNRHLTTEDELTLAQAWIHNKDITALHMLVQSHIKLVVKMALHYRYDTIAHHDLIQEGVLGLLQAALRFDPQTHESRFSSYAKLWIKASMQDYILKNWSIVRVSNTKTHKKLFFNLMRVQNLLHDLQPHLLAHEMKEALCSKLHVQPSDLDHMSGRVDRSDVSLNAVVFSREHETKMDQLIDDGLTPEDFAVQKNHQAYYEQTLRSAMDVLSQKEQFIIKYRYLCESTKTLQDIGHQLHLTRERVRQIELQAIRKMRHHLLFHSKIKKDDMIASL